MESEGAAQKTAKSEQPAENVQGASNTPSFADRIAITRDSLGVVRELVIIIAIVVIVVHPGVLAWWGKSLSQAGAEAGAKHTEVDVGVARMAFETDVAQVSVFKSSVVETDNLRSLAEQLLQSASNPQQKERVREIMAKADSVAAELKAGTDTAQNAALQQDKIIQDAPGQAVGPGTYAIVVSADKRDDLAGYEVQQLKKRKFDVAVYQRQEFLRTVARFPNKDAADAALASIHSYRAGAYTINLNKWCSSPVETGKKIEGAAVLNCHVTSNSE